MSCVSPVRLRPLPIATFRLVVWLPLAILCARANCRGTAVPAVAAGRHGGIVALQGARSLAELAVGNDLGKVPIVRHEHQGQQAVPLSLAEETVNTAAASWAAITLGRFGPDLVKNGDFSHGLQKWEEFNILHRYRGPMLLKCFGEAVAHIKSNCRFTAGGIRQVLNTTPGEQYRLSFGAYGYPPAPEEGSPKDIVRVQVGDLDHSLRVDAQHDSYANDELTCTKNPAEVTVDFVAGIAPEGSELSFWSPQGSCVDVSRVVVRALRAPSPKPLPADEEDSDKTARAQADAKQDLAEDDADLGQQSGDKT